MSKRICSIDWCDKPVIAQGWCWRHYRQWRRTGEPIAPRSLLPKLTPLERITSRIEVDGDCWLWTGPQTPRGYGYCTYEGKHQPVYRALWKILVGPIPEGLEMDHLCRRPQCCNPDHLEPVTHRENVRRSPIHPAMLHARRAKIGFD